MESIYQCPVCQSLLKTEGKSMVCAGRHCYDISRAGYVNLLLANQKNSRDPGDNKDMVMSRKSFLAKNFYLPLAEAIPKLLKKALKDQLDDASQDIKILDIGCGSGYYAAQLSESRAFSKERIAIWGMDISKSAIQIAARSHHKIHFFVGSSFQIPAIEQSVSAVISVFSPFSWEEVRRVLRTDGKFLVVRPGQGHLQELAELIYGKSELQGSNLAGLNEAGFELLEQSQLSFRFQINQSADLFNLVQMTPYGQHLDDLRKKKIEKIKSLNLSANFQLSLFKKLDFA